jgi:hypothetical protein
MTTEIEVHVLPPELIPVFEAERRRARNWGVLCGFGYGFAAALFVLIIMIFTTVPHAN